MKGRGMPWLAALLWMGCNELQPEPPAPRQELEQQEETMSSDASEVMDSQATVEKSAPSEATGSTVSLATIRSWRGPGQGPYEPPTSTEQAEVRTWLERRLAGSRSLASTSWITERGLDSGDLVVFIAAPGHGVYVWRTRYATPLVIETPHSYADVYTLNIGLAAQQELGARALLVNGTHRRFGCTEADAICPADVAHAPTSVFEGVHEAFVARNPGDVVIQFHGFDAGPKDPLLILSAARTRTDVRPYAEALRRVLAPLGAWPVAVYPAEINRLGGTTGVQARQLRAAGGKMLHVEMSRELRDRLVADPAIMRAFVRAFAPPVR